MISRKQILILARSVRLRMEDSEAERMRAQMDAMLQHLEILRQAEMGASPSCPPNVSCGTLRDDEQRQGLSRDQVLQNAPAHQDGYFVVPRTIGER